VGALLESLAEGFDGDATQRATLDAVVRRGLPQTHSESWKYTSLRALERRSFASSASAARVEAAALESIPAPRLVFVNGRHDAALSELAGLPAGVTLFPRSRGTVKRIAMAELDSTADDVFVQIGLALANEGASIDIGNDARGGNPVHLVFVGTAAEADLAWHLRHEIVVGEGADITVVEHQLGCGTHAHLDNAVMHVALSPHSRLVHVRVQNGAIAGTSLLRTEVSVAASAIYERLDLELGAGLSRHEFKVQLTGQGASLVSNGVLLAQGRSHVDARLDIEHVARDTSSQVNWRGLATDRGRAVFRGGITIRPGADGSDARLSNKNLLLSDAAEIDTQPVLEIHADEVKAAHGATVGRLDPAAMFYLRSRGLPESEARGLLTSAFCREPLGMVEDRSLRDFLVSAIDDSLTGLRGG